jgi:acyl-CoA synthetase (AMP-forming)/AMP-acid ligase II
LITRRILNSQLNITVNSETVETHYSYNDIIDYINRAKTFLIKIKQVKKGQRVLILNSKWPGLFIWFLAGAELGLKFIVVDSNAEESKSTLKLYGNIDHLLSDFGEILDWTDTSLQNEYWAEPDSILIETLSSGSTNDPKIVEYTHNFLYKLAHRNSKLYNLQLQDRCIHTRTLAHSSTVGVYFLPVIISCKNHYYFDGKKDKWVKFIKENKINRCLVFLKYLDAIHNNFDNDIDYNFTIFVASKLPNGFDRIINDRIEVISLYGCTETSGPIFLSKLNNKNKLSFQPNDFGELLDNFYKINIKNNLLQVTMPSGQIIDTGDQFSVIDNRMIFQGRGNRYSINNELVDVNLLNNLIIKYINDFDIVIDSVFNEIYLRTTCELNLEELNLNIQTLLGSNYKISKQLSLPKSRFMSGVKFNANAVRIKCRRMIK